MAETAGERYTRDVTSQSAERKTRNYGSQPDERTDREYVGTGGETPLTDNK